MEKNFISKIKQEIKEKAENQKFLKNQRKTVRLIGERKMSSSDAEDTLRKTTYDLCINYIAYYILKHQLEIPEIVERKGYFAPVYGIKDLDPYVDAVKCCCDEKCWLLDEKYKWYNVLEYSAVKVANCIEEWTKKYSENGKEE